MYKKIFFIVGASFILSACSGANITSQLRDFNSEKSGSMLRCTTFSTDNSGTNEKLSKYDGWAMVYTSEYTTENMTSSEMTMCFEKAAK